MPRYLIAVIHPRDYNPAAEGDAMRRDISALNEEMAAAGVTVFVGGLAPQSTSLRAQANGEVLVTDGPYAETKEHLGGFWVLHVADHDAALAWARKATLACRAGIEVRAFN